MSTPRKAAPIIPAQHEAPSYNPAARVNGIAARSAIVSSSPVTAIGQHEPRHGYLRECIPCDRDNVGGQHGCQGRRSPGKCGSKGQVHQDQAHRGTTACPGPLNKSPERLGGIVPVCARSGIRDGWCICRA
jgi:hypothetical protein